MNRPPYLTLAAGKLRPLLEYLAHFGANAVRTRRHDGRAYRQVPR